MTLDQLRPLANRALEPFVDLADRLGLSPDGVSAVAFLLALAAGGAFVLAGERPLLYLAGGVFVFLNGWLDLLDGALARRLETDSAAGDLLDHVLDRYADLVVVAGLAAGIDRYALGFAAVTGVLMTSYLGTQIQAVGLERAYGGILGRADRLALVGLVAAVSTVLPGTFGGLTLVGWLLALFAVVGHLTALQRFYGAWSDLDGQPAVPATGESGTDGDSGGTEREDVEGTDHEQDEAAETGHGQDEAAETGHEQDEAAETGHGQDEAAETGHGQDEAAEMGHGQDEAAGTGHEEDEAAETGHEQDEAAGTGHGQDDGESTADGPDGRDTSTDAG